MRVYYSGTLLALLTLIVSVMGFRWHQQQLETSTSANVPLEKLPYQMGDWTGEDTAGLDVRSQEILQLDSFVKRRYTNIDGDSLLLYIGYWKQQSGDYQAAKHSPALCLPSNGWYVRPQEERKIDSLSGEVDGISKDSLRAKRLIGEYRSHESLFYYWFFTGQTDYTQEWKALLTISLQSLFTGRTDGGIVEISIPLTGNKSAAENLKDKEELVEDFLREFYPELQKLISEGAA